MTPDIITLDDFLRHKLQDFRKKDGVISGYVDNICPDEFLKDLKVLGYVYAVRSSDNNPLSNKILFQYANSKRNRVPSIPYFGIPFIQVKVTYYACSLGKSYHKKYRIRREQQERGETPEKMKRNHKSKKLGCQAWMTVKCIRMFPEFKVPANADKWREKQKVSQPLAELLKSSTPPASILRYYVCASEAACHLHGKIYRKLKETRAKKNSVPNSTESITLNPSDILIQICPEPNVEVSPELNVDMLPKPNVKVLLQCNPEVPPEPNVKMLLESDVGVSPGKVLNPVSAVGPLAVSVPELNTECEFVDQRGLLQGKYSLLGDLLAHVKEENIPQTIQAFDRIIYDISLQLLPQRESVCETIPSNAKDVPVPLEPSVPNTSVETGLPNVSVDLIVPSPPEETILHDYSPPQSLLTVRRIGTHYLIPIVAKPSVLPGVKTLNTTHLKTDHSQEILQ